MGSPKFRLGHEDITKVLKGMLVAGGGAALVYLLDYLQAFDAVDPENWWVPIAVSGASVLVNILRKFATNTQK